MSGDCKIKPLTISDLSPSTYQTLVRFYNTITIKSEKTVSWNFGYFCSLMTPPSIYRTNLLAPEIPARCEESPMNKIILLSLHEHDVGACTITNSRQKLFLLG